jgi:hypothetical protein
MLIEAMINGDVSALAQVPMGGTMKLLNPGGALDVAGFGPHSAQFYLEPPPEPSSPTTAEQLAQLHWMSCFRDVPWDEWHRSPAHEPFLQSLGNREEFHPDFGPLFVDKSWNIGDGPFLSQFLLKRIPFGNTDVDQVYWFSGSKGNYLLTEHEWLEAQRGNVARVQVTRRAQRFIATPRDLAEYVHHDFSHQPYLGAALIALSWGQRALSERHPYRYHPNQHGFVGLGMPDLLGLLSEVSNAALRIGWFYKWFADLYPRPEELAGLAVLARYRNLELGAMRDLGQHPAVEQHERMYQTQLLSQVYSSGCPAHPSYPSGHAVIAGACVTVMKAFFDNDFVIPEPVYPSTDGRRLLPLSQEQPLRLGQELNKLAINISIGRSLAGIHYPFDNLHGLRLGEKVALEKLCDICALRTDLSDGFSLSLLDGSQVLVGEDDLQFD